MTKKKTKQAAEPAKQEVNELIVYCYNPGSGNFVGMDNAFPDPLTPGDWLIPAHATTQQPEIKEGFYPKWNGTEWEQVAIPEPEPTPEPTIEEITADAISKRASLLASSDWTQLPDAPIQNVQEWREYRQALRDITKQKGFPRDINWPEKP